MKNAIALFAILLALVSCSKNSDDVLKKRNAKVLNVNIAAEPKTIDPRKTTEQTGVIITMMLLDGLTREHPSGEVIPALAERIIVSNNFKHYNFHLKKTKWSNGRQLTAYDFENTWKTILTPEFPSSSAHLLYPIKNARAAKNGECSIEEVGVKARGPYHLEVKLEHPSTYFCKLIATRAFLPYPDDIAEENERIFANGLQEELICNGPFIMTGWKFSHEITFVKNPSYWDRRTVKLDGINMSLVNDQMSALQMFDRKEIDWVGGPLSSLPEEAIPTLLKTRDVEFLPVSGVYYYIFNTKRFPFTNAKIRKALSYAIDREAIINHVLQDGQIPAYRFIPTIMAKNDIQYYENENIEEAQRLFEEGLDELGIRHSEFPTIPLLYNNTYPKHYKIAQVVQERLRKVFNIKVELVNREWKVYLDDIQNNDFMLARVGASAAYNDPFSFLESFTFANTRLNYSGWQCEEYNDTIREMVLTSDAKVRREYVKKAEKILMDEMPIIPIFFYNESFMKHDYVKGIFLSEIGNLDFKWATIKTK